MEGEDLIALQILWEEKLRESGFEDIEKRTPTGKVYLKTCHSLYFHQTYEPEVFAAKEEYYRRASQFLYDYKFPWFHSASIVNLKEREIWRLHSEGKSMRDIAERLRPAYRVNKDSVNEIIKKIQSIMWDYEER